MLPPFCLWKLPDEYRLDFKVTKSKMVMGSYEPDPHTITISSIQNSNFQQVIETMAHEMVHLKLERDGDDGHADHSQTWKETSELVCQFFGWKKESF
jgi:Zn-dependent peptidase ImmA (M78 family)